MPCRLLDSMDNVVELLRNTLKDPGPLLDGLLDPSKSGRGRDRVTACCVDKRDLAGVDGLLIKGVERSSTDCFEAMVRFCE